MTSEFEPRILVNAGQLRQNANKTISIMLKVDSEAGNNLTATSTDKQKVQVKLPDMLGSRPGNWVEVIGTPVGGDSIRATEVRFGIIFFFI